MASIDAMRELKSFAQGDPETIVTTHAAYLHLLRRALNIQPRQLYEAKIIPSGTLASFEAGGRYLHFSEAALSNYHRALQTYLETELKQQDGASAKELAEMLLASETKQHIRDLPLYRDAGNLHRRINPAQGDARGHA